MSKLSHKLGFPWLENTNFTKQAEDREFFSKELKSLRLQILHGIFPRKYYFNDISLRLRGFVEKYLV